MLLSFISLMEEAELCHINKNPIVGVIIPKERLKK